MSGCERFRLDQEATLLISQCHLKYQALDHLDLASHHLTLAALDPDHLIPDHSSIVAACTNAAAEAISNRMQTSECSLGFLLLPALEKPHQFILIASPYKLMGC